MVETHGQISQNDRKYHGQRWIARFVCKEGAKPSDIHRRRSAVCG